MILNKCKHKWKLKSESKYSLCGIIPAYYMCKKCKRISAVQDVFQLETLEHLEGFQKYLAIIAVVISFVTLLISSFKN